MGVKNFIRFIEKYAPGAIRYKKISDYQGLRIGIDANLFIYKIIYGIRVRGYDLKNDDLVITHIHSMLLKFMGFLKYNIRPIFVFDNMMPSIKSNALKKRAIAKKKMILKHKSSKTKEGKRKYYYASTSLTSGEIDDCKKLILIFGYNYINAKEEADSQLVNLLKNNLIDLIVSDDMDILLFGGNLMLKNFTIDSKKYIQQIDLDLILSESRITMDQLIQIGLLHGTDYCEKNLSSSKAYHTVINGPNVSVIDPRDDCQEAYEYFINAPTHNSHNIQINQINFDLCPDTEKLSSFLSKHRFKDDYIDLMIKNVRKYTECA
jgi:flap endonuclease-1